jgi:acyl carrier protein
VSSVQDRVQEVARSVFDDDSLILDGSTTAREVPGWDSLGHVNFMYSVEEEFGVHFTDEEYSGFDDVGALVRTLERKLGDGPEP